MSHAAPQVKPGVYRHFRGGRYKVLGVAEDTEIQTHSVVYLPIDGEHAWKLRTRPLAMFVEQVSRPEIDYEGPRFALLTECDFIGHLRS
jgi:hypothetical protein